MIKVFAVHTATALVEPITTLFKKNLPEIKLNHIAEMALTHNVLKFNLNQVLKFFYANQLVAFLNSVFYIRFRDKMVFPDFCRNEISLVTFEDAHMLICRFQKLL